MSRILLVWELGGGFGHIGGFIPLAEELKRRGHEPILVLRNLVPVETLAAGADIPLLQAPLWQGAGRQTAPKSYAEILSCFGFFDVKGLTSMVNAWRNLFSLTAPDLILFDHAPTALLASRGLPAPRALYGTGFFSPPRVTPFPPMRWWRQHSRQHLVEIESKVLATANTVLRRYDLPPMKQLTNVFDVEEDFLCTLREFDHYPKRGGNPQYWGPRNRIGAGREPVWPAGTGRKVFAYLDTKFKDLEKLLQTFSTLPARFLVYAPGISQQQVERYQAAHVAFSPDPINFEKIGGQCDAGICHANHGTVSALLLAGIPLLLLPSQLEQYILALNVQNLGAGLVVNPEDKNSDYALPLQRLLAEPVFGKNAQSFAAKYAGENQQERVNKIATRCEETIARFNS